MSDPITVPLSVYQQQRFRALRADMERLMERQNDAVTAILAGAHDPASFQGWSIALTETAIVCTPPAD